MKNYRQKIDQLKWLKLAGVDHYFNKEPLDQYIKTNGQNFVQQVLDLKKSSNSLEKKPLLIKSKPVIKPSIKLESIQPERSTNKANLAGGDIAASKVNSNSNSGDTKHILDTEFSRTEENLQLADSVTNILRALGATENNEDMIEKSRNLADKAASLEELKEMVSNFDGCNLRNLAQNTVFSSGRPDAQVMFIGEAPGASEDAQGIPFCGESGKLLDKMLESINLSRETNAYITNTVFWRPPANRRPTQEEIDICRPFVEKHIALLAPKLIILVGATAATSLIGKHSGISNIKKNAFKYSNPYLKNPINMMAIFHPAYLLRQPMKKKDSWYDLIKIQQHILENGIKL